jgi:hypothetical protein
MKLELNNREVKELVKQDKVTKKKRLVKSIKPYNGHTLYKYDRETKLITKALFDVNPCINWYDAVNGLYSRYKKLTIEENCIYISALNKVNVRKILKRDYNI